jgi:site-specific DNA recombinase
VSRELFAAVEAILGRKPRARYPKQRHAFMGLLTCGRCGCSITAEKKATYTYYRCTGYHGKCGNTNIREEQLATLLGTAVERIQIPEDIANWIAEGLRESQGLLEQARQETLARLTQRHKVGKLEIGGVDGTRAG